MGNVCCVRAHQGLIFSVSILILSGCSSQLSGLVAFSDLGLEQVGAFGVVGPAGNFGAVDGNIDSGLSGGGDGGYLFGARKFRDDGGFHNAVLYSTSIGGELQREPLPGVRIFDRKITVLSYSGPIGDLVGTNYINSDDQFRYLWLRVQPEAPDPYLGLGTSEFVELPHHGVERLSLSQGAYGIAYILASGTLHHMGINRDFPSYLSLRQINVAGKVRHVWVGDSGMLVVTERGVFVEGEMQFGSHSFSGPVARRYGLVSAARTKDDCLVLWSVVEKMVFCIDPDSGEFEEVSSHRIPFGYVIEDAKHDFEMESDYLLVSAGAERKLMILSEEGEFSFIESDSGALNYVKRFQMLSSGNLVIHGRLSTNITRGGQFTVHTNILANAIWEYTPESETARLVWQEKARFMSQGFAGFGETPGTMLPGSGTNPQGAGGSSGTGSAQGPGLQPM